jgi:transcriptional regulator with XRE-family HTH domain
MFFSLGLYGKTVKELRKNRGLTAGELAFILKMDTVELLKIDAIKVRDIPEPLKSRIIPILRGDDLDKIPWL